MKKMIIVLLVAIVPAKAYNQISQGSVIVGGEFSLELSKNKTEQDNNTDDGPTRTNFRIMPDVEYFLAENLSTGLGLGYTLSKTTTEATNSETTRKNGTFVIMPYLKKYFTLGERAYFYGQALAAFGFGDETTEVRAGSVTTSIEESSVQMCCQFPFLHYSRNQICPHRGYIPRILFRLPILTCQ